MYELLDPSLYSKTGVKEAGHGVSMGLTNPQWITDTQPYIAPTVDY